MKKSIFILLALALLVSSCQNDELLENEPLLAQTTEGIHVCTELDPVLNGSEGGDELRAALLKNWKWTPGTTIRVKFLNGSSFLHEKVKKYVREWTVYANLKFQFVGVNESADIKIGFKWGGDSGSWSYVGTVCKSIAQNKPSMNFGWFETNTAENEFSRVILHEFGHALGLTHEQQHPTNNISWNKPVVYAYYAKNSGWTKSQVDQWVFNKEAISQTNYSRYDGASIMHYAIERSWTTNGYSVGWNSLLSSTDKSFAGQQYPYPSNTKGFYRYYLGTQHFYTSNFEELRNNSFEHIMGRVYNSQVSATLPIYRYCNTTNGDRLSTLNWNELKSGGGAWRYEGISGYAYNSQKPNTIPVYRYSRTSPKPEHFLTTSSTEVSGGKYGFRSEGIAFYILRN